MKLWSAFEWRKCFFLVLPYIIFLASKVPQSHILLEAPAGHPCPGNKGVGRQHYSFYALTSSFGPGSDTQTLGGRGQLVPTKRLWELHLPTWFSNHNKSCHHPSPFLTLLPETKVYEHSAEKILYGPSSEPFFFSFCICWTSLADRAKRLHIYGHLLFSLQNISKVIKNI